VRPPQKPHLSAEQRRALELLAGGPRGYTKGREEGKTLPEGIGEVVRAGQTFAFFAGEAVRMSGEKIASTGRCTPVTGRRGRRPSSPVWADIVAKVPEERPAREIRQ
jgi:hypothetical protein